MWARSAEGEISLLLLQQVSMPQEIGVCSCNSYKGVVLCPAWHSGRYANQRYKPTKGF